MSIIDNSISLSVYEVSNSELFLEKHHKKTSIDHLDQAFSGREILYPKHSFLILVQQASGIEKTVDCLHYHDEGHQLPQCFKKSDRDHKFA